MTKGKILLVEDEQIVILDLKDNLHSMGYEVVAVAASARDALQAADDLRPDLILMDIVLQGQMDGIEAAEQIKAQSGIPVVFLTAHADEATLKRAKLTEPFGYIIKPFEESSLQATIEMAMALSQVQKRLRESEQKVTHLLKYAPAGIYELDMDNGKVLSVNDIMCQYSGYSREELLSMDPTSLLLGGGREHFLGRQASILAGEQIPETTEYQIQAKDGSSLWISIAVRFRRTEDGSTVATVVAHDITERKQAEEALRHYKDHLEELVEERTTDLASANAQLKEEIGERVRTEKELRTSQRKFQQLVNLSQAGIYEVDLVQNRFVSVNDYVCDMTGYSRQELLDMSPMQLMTPESQVRFLERQQKSQNGTGVPEGVQYEIVRKDGQRIWGMIASRLVYEGGTPSRAIVVAHDVTERVQAERQLRSALQEKEVLLQEVHHRVKNNLQLVSSLLDMQSLSAQDDGPLSVLQDSRNRVKTMALVHDTLYQSADLASVDVGRYLEGTVDNLAGIYSNGIRPVLVDVQVKDVVLDLDAAITCGLMVNELVSNALKHAFPPDGQAQKSKDHKDTITVRLAPESADSLVLSVTDNGMGIPSSVDLTHTRSLGLRLVTMLTQQLGGTVELDRNMGTAFTIVFPHPSDAVPSGE